MSMIERRAPTDAEPAAGPSPSDAPEPSSPAELWDPDRPDPLPDFGAEDPVHVATRADDDPADERETPFPAWAVVAIVALVVGGLLAGVSIVAGALESAERLAATPSASPTPPAPPSDTEDPSAELVPGTVSGPDGEELPDGSFSDPGAVGVHTMSWPTWDGGTVSLRATHVEPDGTLPGAGGVDVVEPDHQLVLATFEVSYEGPGQFQPNSEIWVTGQTDRDFVEDVLPGLSPDAMNTVGAIRDGQSATFRSGFVLDSAQMDTARIVLQPYDGEPLYYAVS